MENFVSISADNPAKVSQMDALSILRFKTKYKNKNPGPFGPRQSASGTRSCMRILDLFRLDGMQEVHKKVGAEDQHLIFKLFCTKHY